MAEIPYCAVTNAVNPLMGIRSEHKPMGVAVGVGDGLKVAVGVGDIVDVGSAVGAGGDQLRSGVLPAPGLVVDKVGASGLLAV